MNKPTGLERIAGHIQETFSGIHQRPLGLYAILSLVALPVLFLIHLTLTTLLSLLGAEAFSTLINTPFALLYGWTVTGLFVTVLLYTWLKLKPVAVALSLTSAVLWLLGLRRHAGSLSIVLYLLPLPAAGVIFWVGLRRASDVLLPTVDQAQRANVLSFLRAYVLGSNRPAYVVDPTRRARKVRKRVPGDQFSRVKSSPGLVVTGCDHAVALSDGFRFKGVHGPGIVFTGYGDQIVQAIDLRPQERSFRVTGLTKDGIESTVDASVSFRIDAGRREPELGQHLPFNRGAAFRALGAQRVEHQGEERIRRTLERREWDDLPRVRGEHILRDIISKLEFDELYGPHQPGGEAPRRRIARAFTNQLEAELEPFGIQLIDADLGNLEPAAPEVYLRRARNWEAEWSRQITLKQAEGQAQRLQILERARADTRADLILDLGRQLEEFTESSTDLDAGTVFDQFLVVLEELSTQPQLRHLLPDRTMELLSEMRKVVGE
jgi:regulator of protease activity HflC (stomatin/prohibitin superfamily)